VGHDARARDDEIQRPGVLRQVDRPVRRLLVGPGGRLQGLVLETSGDALVDGRSRRRAE
jgi:hypothetical protein